MKLTHLLLLTSLLFSSHPLIADETPAISGDGYWVYGFELSLFENCDGKRYWMWVAPNFNGTYREEGYKNPVHVRGTIHSPAPEENMYSTLAELKVTHIEHRAIVCNDQQ